MSGEPALEVHLDGSVGCEARRLEDEGGADRGGSVAEKKEEKGDVMGHAAEAAMEKARQEIQWLPWPGDSKEVKADSDQAKGEVKSGDDTAPMAL